MTIAIGLRCKDGVILCADTQETFDGTKRNVPKLVVKNSSTDPDRDLVLAVAGAGDGPFIDRLTSDIWNAIQNCTDLQDACLAADDEILRVYDRYATSFAGNMPAADLVFAVRSQEGVRLFHAAGQIVNEVTSRSVGIGHILSDYLLDRMHFTDTGVGFMLQIATYVLMETKKYVEGCGGDSHIVLIPDAGIPYLKVPQSDIAAREKMYKPSDIFLDFMKHVISNPDNDLARVAEMVEIMKTALIRNGAKLRADEEATKKIISGESPTPSTPHSSEDQP